MINKKAILREESVKLFIAAICIVLLLILFFKLMGLFTKKTAMEQARESIKVLMDEIDKVQKGQESKEFFLESPAKWWVIAWPYKNEGNKPEQCKLDYCICLCAIPTLPSKANSLTECSNGGICKDVNTTIRTIYEAEPPNWFAKVLSSFVNEPNKPIDIGGPLPLKVVIENNEIHVKKQRNV